MAFWSGQPRNQHIPELPLVKLQQFRMSKGASVQLFWALAIGPKKGESSWERRKLHYSRNLLVPRTLGGAAPASILDGLWALLQNFTSRYLVWLRFTNNSNPEWEGNLYVCDGCLLHDGSPFMSYLLQRPIWFPEKRDCGEISGCGSTQTRLWGEKREDMMCKHFQEDLAGIFSSYCSGSGTND